jgi:cytochrome c-type biogenesis protein CcmE
VNRKFRLIAALGVAVTLATFTLYVAISGGSVQEPVLQAAQLASSKRALATEQIVQVDGIANGPVTGAGTERMTFFLADRDGKHSTKVVYRGSVPDAFRVGRNVIVKGKLVERGDSLVFRAEPNSLVTKCPSKFESDGGTSRSDG